MNRNGDDTGTRRDLYDDLEDYADKIKHYAEDLKGNLLSRMQPPIYKIVFQTKRNAGNR